MSDKRTVFPRTYNVLPGTRMGVLSADYLRRLAEVVREHNIPFVKITSAQRLAIAGHDDDETRAIWRGLGHENGPAKPLGVHYIQACPGVTWCKYGRKDSLAMGERLQEALSGMALPAKTKVGVSGCPMNCCESFIRDVGLFGKKSGWTLIFGGNGGGLPRIGDIVCEGLSDEEATDLAVACLAHYRDNGRGKERTARFMERTGIAALQSAVCGKGNL